MLAYHKPIDKKTTMKNQNRSAALGRPGASVSLQKSTNLRPLFYLGSSDTELFGLHGRFLAHKYIILEIQKSKIKLR